MVLLLLPLIIAVFVVFNLWSGYYAYTPTTNLGIWGNDFVFPQILTLTLGPLFALVNALLINSLFNRNDFIDRNTYITSVIYLSYFSFYHAFYQLDGLSISHLLLVLALFEIFKLAQNEKGNKAVFNAGFLAGLACTFDPALLLFFPFLYLMVIVIRPVLLREFILFLIGFGVPLLYAIVFSWYNEFPISTKLITWQIDNFKFNIDFVVTATLLVLTVLLSLIALSQHSQKTSIRAKKLMRALFLFTLFCLFLGSLEYLFHGHLARFSLLFIPISFFLTFAWQNKRYQWLSSALIYLVLIYTFLRVFIKF
jgi:hypothetical protein